MRKLLWVIIGLVVVAGVLAFARQFNSPLKVRMHEHWMAGTIAMQGNATPFEFAVDWQHGEASPSIYLNYLPEASIDWWQSLLSLRKVEAPWQDEMVQIRTHDGALLEWWVTPEGETFCFGSSPLNTRVPFHRHEETEIRSGCPYRGDPQGPRRTAFEREGEAHVLHEERSNSEPGRLRSQYRDLTIQRAGKEVYRILVDSYDESYLWTKASLAAGKLVRVPHGFTRLEFYDFVEVIDWATGETVRVDLPELEGFQLPASETWLRVDREGYLRLGGVFAKNQGVGKTWGTEIVLQRDAMVERTFVLGSRNEGPQPWGTVKHDWIDVAGRIAMVQTRLMGVGERGLSVEVVFGNDSTSVSGLGDLIGSGTNRTVMNEFGVYPAPDLDGDGIDDILCIVGLDSCPEASHAWWFASGDNGSVLRRSP